MLIRYYYTTKKGRKCLSNNIHRCATIAALPSWHEYKSSGCDLGCLALGQWKQILGAVVCDMWNLHGLNLFSWFRQGSGELRGWVNTLVSACLVCRGMRSPSGEHHFWTEVLLPEASWVGRVHIPPVKMARCRSSLQDDQCSPCHLSLQVLILRITDVGLHHSYLNQCMPLQLLHCDPL